MKLTENQVVAIKRKRGELDLTIKELEQATKVSRWTLIDIFKHNHRNVNKVTFKKLNDWLINEYERSTQQWSEFIEHSKTGYIYQMATRRNYTI